jgi:hypothetical protein
MPAITRGRLHHWLKHERMSQIDSGVSILFVVSLNQILATGFPFRVCSPVALLFTVFVPMRAAFVPSYLQQDPTL